MNRRMLSVTLVLALILSFAAAAWAAQGMLLVATRVPAAVAEQIEAARVANPQVFAVVQRMVAEAPQLAAESRNHRAMLTPHLRQAGPEALWPLLDLIAFHAPDRSAFTDEQWIDTQCSILEAAGMIRDARALPVFVAVLADAGQPAMVTRFAAEAVGRVGTDEAVRHLQTQLNAAGGERRTAILAGMGQCRRAAVARILATELGRNPAENVRRALIESLRDVGNSWAWETPVIAASGEGLATRRIATEALVRAFPRVTMPEREEITKALQVVNHPQAIALVQQARAKAADAELRAAYDRLIERLKNNPLSR